MRRIAALLLLAACGGTAEPLALPPAAEEDVCNDTAMAVCVAPQAAHLVPFGSVVVGARRELALEIGSVEEAVSLRSLLSIPPPFSARLPDGEEVTPGSSTRVIFAFAPTSLGEYAVDVEVAGLKLQLAGWGVEPFLVCETAALDLGTGAVGETLEARLACDSTSELAIRLSSTWAVGGNGFDATYDEMLLGRARLEVNIRFEAESPGSFYDHLRFVPYENEYGTEPVAIRVRACITAADGSGCEGR
ncbi:hypothetical protein [Vulgatibacter sp.]|uniref:hypothetical protein n=1 Tax=Vulgatibacter sp. TaxID=1971226 RepID=UPI0035676619